MALAENPIEKTRYRYNIRKTILESLYRYIEEGCPTGGFLYAVLCNDLKESMGRADDYNRIFLFDIISFLYNEAPSPCWGSPEKVKAWIERFKIKENLDA